MSIYDTEIRQKIAKRLQINNPMEIPRISKVVLNIGMGEAVANKSSVEKAQQQLSTIAGQKAVVTKARKSISAFKIRQGLPIGVKVTLRGNKMDGFLKRIVYSILPRIRDFRGIKDQAVDQNGNLNLGFTEQTIFPEIDFDSIDRIRGLQVTVVTNARNYDRGRVLFEEIGIPFVKK
jgi:large subunit ribosomal protein L5